MEFLRTKKRNLHGGIKACPAFGLLMNIDGLLWHHLGEEKRGGRHDWIPKARRFSENLEEKETSNSSPSSDEVPALFLPQEKNKVRDFLAKNHFDAEDVNAPKVSMCGLVLDAGTGWPAWDELGIFGRSANQFASRLTHGKHWLIHSPKKIRRFYRGGFIMFYLLLYG